MKVKKQALACALTCCVAGGGLSGIASDSYSANDGGMKIGYYAAKKAADEAGLKEDGLARDVSLGAGLGAGAWVGAKIGALVRPVGSGRWLRDRRALDALNALDVHN